MNEAITHTLKLCDKNKLLAVYMPFIKNGGIFVQTNISYPLGQPIKLVLQLPEEEMAHTVMGKVVWITPMAAQGGLPAGVGVQMEANDTNVLLRAKIENSLKGMLSVNLSYTL
jgi:type IV pilus assembly protein PilZ